MSQIKKERIKMKPKWYFLLGSISLIIGAVALVIILVFLISLISFSLRSHGPMGEIRYQQLLSSFPWWALISAALGFALGIFLIRKNHFSYRKNSLYIIVALAFVIFLSGFIIDYLGLDNMWMKRGPMKALYGQHSERGLMGPGNRVNFK